MKKTLINTLIICIIIVSSISCQKQNELTPETNNTKVSDVVENAKLFRQGVENRNSLKSGNQETISLDSAIQVMETSFNFYHGFFNSNYSNVQYDSVIITTKFNLDSEVNMSEVYDMYVLINNSITDIYNNCTYESKELKFVDIYFETIENVNYVKTYLAIGEKSNLKSGVELVVVEENYDGLWLGLTPFNSQSSETWELADGYNTLFTYYIQGYSPFRYNTEVAEALNSKLTYGVGVFSYDVRTIEVWANSAVYGNTKVQPHYEDIYEFNNDIASTTEYADGSNSISRLFFVYDGNWPTTSRCYYDHYNGTTITTPAVNYKYMNKYYNVCRALITYNKPSTHKTINADVASYIRDSYCSYCWPRYVRALQGHLKISYGKELPSDDYEPCELDYIN